MALYQLVETLRGEHEEAAAAAGLTAPQATFLTLLSEPMSMRQFAELMGCDASNVTGIVDKLELRGLIARQGADHDRRVKQLAVTERGCSIRDKLVAAVMNPPAAVAALPSDVKTRLTTLLRGLLNGGGLSR